MPPLPPVPSNDEGARPVGRESDAAQSALDTFKAGLRCAVVCLGNMFKGFDLFFVHRLPKWTYEFVRRISHSLGQVGRIVVYSALVVLLAVAFVGFPYGLNAVGVPLPVTFVVAALEVVAILVAVLVAVQR